MIEKNAYNKKVYAKKKHQMKLALKLCINHHSLKKCVKVML